MKKLFLILLMFHLTITGTFAQEQISVSRFQGQKITGIEAHGAFNITARQGTSTGVTVNIPTRFEKHLVLKLNSQGKLFIGFDGRMKDKDKKNRHHDEFTAEITVTDLNSIELTGVCKLEAIGNFTTDRLEIDLSGASKFLAEGNFQVNRNLKIGMSGASHLSGPITSPESDINISGASRLTLKGNTSRCKLKVSGAAKATLEKFPIDILEAEISGAAKVWLQVKETLSIHTSGAAKAMYSGNPEIITLESSGASNVNKISSKSSKTGDGNEK